MEQSSPPEDQVWHLGDVGVTRDEETLATVARLNGTKHLIAGNHDSVWPGHRTAHQHQRAWLTVFESVQAFARRRIGKGESVILNHFPYRGSGDHTTDERYTQYRLPNEGLWLIHGHVHDAWDQRDRQINVGVDVRKWRPIHLTEIMEIMRKDEPMISPLNPSTHARPLPATSHPVMAQVGWLGHRAGHIYALADQPFDTAREPGGFSPLYIQIGTWTELEDGRYGIRD